VPNDCRRYAESGSWEHLMEHESTMGSEAVDGRPDKTFDTEIKQPFDNGKSVDMGNAMAAMKGRRQKQRGR
jgi:hypothetical protein